MATLCSSETQLIEVNNPNDALRLAEIVNCTGSGSFFVRWTGRVETPVTIVVSNGTSLNVTGLEGGVIDGGSMVQLFSVSSATLSLSDLALEHGNATDGGVLQALASTVFVTDCNITANFGIHFGGAFALEDTALFLDGNVTFRDNRASSQGGAIRATMSSVVIGGTSRFEDNYAGKRGGGLALISSCQLNLTGESYFVQNTAGTSGGSIFGTFSDMNISGHEAYAYFAGNVAGSEFGGALYWRGEEASISIEAPSYFVNNSSPTAGAVYLSGTGLQASISNAVFESNVASKNGGALVTHVIGLSSNFAVVQGCRFDGNIAEVSGGAMVASAGFITVEDSIFRFNTADDSGGAILSDGGYTVSGFDLAQTEISYNQAGTGPAIAQTGNTEDGAARFVTFVGVTFTGNTLLCDHGEFLNQITNDTVAEEYVAYDTACSSCSNFTACVNCTVSDDDTVALCYPVLGHTWSPDRDGTLASLQLDEGYWRTSNASSEILQCYNEDACVGGVAEMCGDVSCEYGYCAEGYTGPYCAVCASGYSEGQSKTCYPCGGASSQAAKALGIIGMVALIFLLLLAYNYLTSAGQDKDKDQDQDQDQDQARDGGEFGTKKKVSRLTRLIPFQALKILIVAWQIVTEFASVANVTFPFIYRNFLYVIEVVKLDLTSFLSFGCLIKTDFFDRLLVVTISPLVLLALLGVTFWVARRHYRRQGPEMEEIRRKHVSAFVLVTFLVYSPVSAVVFQTFACDPLDDGYSYLRADYRILCRDASGELNTRYMGFLVYAALMALLYPLGIPTFYAVILFMGWKRRPQRAPVVVDRPSRISRSYSQARDSFFGEAREEQSKFDQTRAGGVDDVVRDLSKPYKTDCFYYEVVECVRRVMLTGAVVFVFPDSVAQVSTTFLLALVFFAVFEVQNPYESIQNSWTSRLGHLIVLLSMFTALLLKVDLTDETDTGEELFSAILVAANVVMIVAVVAQSILSFYVEVLED